MFNHKGATSLSYLRGEKMIDKDRRRKFTRVNISELTRDQEEKVRELARRSGRTFQECAAEVLAGQKNLKQYEEG